MNKESIGQFRHDGYIVLDERLEPHQLSCLRTICNQLLDEPCQEEGNGTHRLNQGAARQFLRHRHRDFPELADFLLSGRMARVVSACLGHPGYLFNEQFVIKGSGEKGSFSWHQDGAYVGFAHRPYLSIWIALDDTSKANGCLYLLPRNLDRKPDIDPHLRLGEGDELIGYTGDNTGVPVECPSGSIVCFSSLTLHRSGVNSTGRVRRAYLCQFSPEPLLDPSTGMPKRFAEPQPSAPAITAAAGGGNGAPV